MLSFFAGAFAVAGAIAAAGPVIIHLLNRRRYRVVHWAAMDFLREALQRNRRILQLRDLLLLALRTACVLLFGLAMARPYFSQADGAIDPDQPVHAILIVDNSLSMGYAKLDGTLLDEARLRAGEFIDRLPEGSRISVLPLCAAGDEFSLDPYRTKDDARRALGRMEVVDRQGSAAQAADLALAACGQAPDLPAKRVVFLGDQQSLNWPEGAVAAQLKQLPELQVVQISRPEVENAWISEFKLQDGIADVETGAVFLATVSYEGQDPRNDVQVTLTIDGVAAASKTISLEPGQNAEVSFPYRFDVTTEPGQPSFVAAEVSIPPDRLPQDDHRFLMAPVVAALPVVFVDQLGSDEDPKKNQYGETFLLRRLLAPVTTRGDFGRQLIQIRHTTIDELDRSMLEDARLVVVAGVQRPDAGVTLLRDFVRQGGQLVLAAGGAFDAAAWTSSAWLDGGGILPAPLKGEPLGQLPSEATTDLTAFQLSFESMTHDYFLIENEARQALADLYGVPVFFKAVAADLSEETIKELLAAETRRITDERQALADFKAQLAQALAAETSGSMSEADRLAREQAERRLAELEPSWLLWNEQEPLADEELPPAEAALRTRPQLLASYTNKAPFMIQRRMGRGQVVFISTGVYSNSSAGSTGWNNLVTTDAVLLFDRVFRSMLQRTLSRRTLDSVERVTVPVPPGDRRDRFSLARPGGGLEPMTVDALGADLYGVTVRNIAERGHYRLTAYRPESAEVEGPDSKHWEVALAVNGPPAESELAAIDEATLRDRLGEGNYRWVPAGGTISLEGAQVQGQDLWRWFMLALLVCLLLELAVLAWPLVAKERAA